VSSVQLVHYVRELRWGRWLLRPRLRHSIKAEKIDSSRFHGNKCAANLWFNTRPIHAKNQLFMIAKKHIWPLYGLNQRSIYALTDKSTIGRELLPMRYRLLPPASCLLPSTDVEVPPQYNVFNARRDSLRSARSWKPIFGSKHAIFPFEKFYEWVEREGRKVELIFAPDGYPEMWAASLFEETKTRDGVIRSFAMVTDDPPPEVATAGHDRCPVFLREDLIDEWLQPEETGLDRLDSLLDYKQPAYFSNAMAA